MPTLIGRRGFLAHNAFKRTRATKSKNKQSCSELEYACWHGRHRGIPKRSLGRRPVPLAMFLHELEKESIHPGSTFRLQNISEVLQKSGAKNILYDKNHISLLTRRFHVYLWHRCCLHLHWRGRWCLQWLWFWKPSLASVRGPKRSHQYLYDQPLFHGSCLWPPT